MHAKWWMVGLGVGMLVVSACAKDGTSDPDTDGDADADADADVDADGDGDPDGGVLVEPDLCGNGLNDDGDARVDEGCACLPGESTQCYAGEPALAGVGVCAKGEMECLGELVDEFGEWGPCAGYLPPTEDEETSCDGLDNDCDGSADEGCACEEGGTRGCYAGPAGTEGVGVCRGGQQPCVAAEGGAVWGDCAGEILPSAEICDGADNDCDAVVDEGCGCAVGATEACYEGPADTRGRGTCADGQRVCDAGDGGIGSAWGDCGGWVGPGDEVCNALDDDCDGTIDEGCSCDVGETRTCYSGSAQTRGQGLCRDGTQTCVAGGGGSEWGGCGGEVLPAAELCDGADNDCDGAIDDGACNLAPSALCPGAVETEPFTTVDIAGDGMDPDGAIVSWLWEVVAAPAGSAAQPVPTDAQNTSFTPDIVGIYRLRLTVTDDDGNTASCEVEVRVRGLGLRVNIYWNPPDQSCRGPFPEPGCDGSDVDLHLLHEDSLAWFDPGLDCYWATCRRPGLRWDANGRADDPRLDLDDQLGYGPENVNIDEPVLDSTYGVGVHYWYDRDWGPAEVYVNIYCGDVAVNPVASYGPVSLEGPNENGVANDFWRVADVRWDGNSCTVFDVDSDGNDLWTETDARLGR